MVINKFTITLDLDQDFVNMVERLKSRYGEEFSKLNGFHNDNLNFTSFIDHFVDSNTLADATIDGNANSSVMDVTSLMQDMMKPHTKLLSFNKIFVEMKKKYGLEHAEVWLMLEWVGASYLHNAHSASFKPYCFAYDLDGLAERGLFFIDGYKTKPAGHLDTFNKHILQFVSWTSNLSTGACGIPSYLLYSYYFWKKDVESGYCADSERYRDQEFQSFIYNMNQPFLRVTQSAFTNLSIFDRNYFVELFGGRTFPDGSPMYPCCDEFMEYQKAFMRMVVKVRKDQMFTFPVLSYSLLFKDGEFVDKEFARWCSDTNCDWNDSNFYIGNDVTVLSNCCRLLSDMSELDGFMNSIGGTSLKIGSAVVNTINLRRIGLHVGFDEDRYIDALREQAQLSIEVMDVIRGILSRNVEKGILPNYSSGLVEMDKQFNTIGVTAMYETMRDFGYIETDEVGDEFYSDKGLAFATRIFDELNKIRKNSGLGYSLNIECVPAERANVILAQKDNLMHPEHDVGDFVYSNQWIPLMHRCSIEEKVHLGSVLDKMCGGGQISHINLSAPFEHKDQAWDMLNYIARQGVIYFAFNTKISVCEDGHAFYGDTCPTCGKKVVDTFQRIVGFLTPRSSYSKERKKEFDKRYWFNFND